MSPRDVYSSAWRRSPFIPDLRPSVSSTYHPGHLREDSLLPWACLLNYKTKAELGDPQSPSSVTTNDIPSFSSTLRPSQLTPFSLFCFVS